MNQMPSIFRKTNCRMFKKLYFEHLKKLKMKKPIRDNSETEKESTGNNLFYEAPFFLLHVTTDDNHTPMTV